MTDLGQRLEAILRGAPSLMQALTIARDIDLPDWLMVSGAVYQRVLNHLSGRGPDYGVKDYDLAYFDAADVSWEGEDAIIRRAADAFPPSLANLIEVRNQARVHLWFESKFGDPYMPLFSTAEALERYVSPMFAVGVRLEADRALTVVAPFGLEDLFALRLRSNPNRRTASFDRVCAGILARWPEVTVAAD